ncbi:hypothetical protein IWQ57_003003 [Coemansia nantahalensis]|uniref:Uncharacterized protein n=1 Tax=Coemansia nantahalensis TaxID=2789366 RepID=A0ACC1JYD0_9FUNG|nr:hypothetical protein IWQ57_003003 [Coemansia nantahalensis]
MAGDGVADSLLAASGVLVDRDEAAAAEDKAGEMGTVRRRVVVTSPVASDAEDEDEKKRAPRRPAGRLLDSSIVVLALRRALKGPAPTLDHVMRFLASGSGHDKFWMVAQYFTKIVVWVLARRGGKSAAERVRLFSSLVADYRIMIRLPGLLGMAQAIRHCEQSPAPSRTLQWLDRAMNLSLVCYYPLEHAYWLGAHRILPLSDRAVEDAGYWSCRFWAAWVAMQFARLGVEHRQIAARRRRVLTRGSADAATMQHELDAVDADARSWKIQLLINACYFPLTLHWSVRGSTFPEVAVGVFGTVAAIAQAYNVWQATA